MNQQFYRYTHGSKGCAFVNACKEGNVEAVKQLLSTANFQSVYNGIVAAFDNNQRYIKYASCAKCPFQVTLHQFWL